MNLVTPRVQWTKAGLVFLLPVVLIAALLIGCKTSSQSGTSDEQKQLIALSKTLPSISQLEGSVVLEDDLDSRTRTVRELVHIFMTNRDWTESLQKKESGGRLKTYSSGSASVIIHEKQSDAAFQLIQLGPQAKAAAPAMVQSLTNSEFLTRQWAAGQKSTDLSDLAIARCESLNRSCAIRVLQAIGSASPEVVPALVYMLHVPPKKNEPYPSGYEAADALIIISLTDTNVLPAVIAKLESDPESPEAENSVRVLKEFGAEAHAAVPTLIRVLANSKACDTTITALGSIGPDAAPAVPYMLRLYEQWQGDEKFAQRRMIVVALGKIGPTAKKAVPMLKGLLNRNYESFEAVGALWRIDPQNAQFAIGVACGVLNSKATLDRPHALGLLGEIGPPAQSAVSILLQVLDAPLSDAIAFDAAWALWRIDPSQKEKVVAVLEKIRKHEPQYPYECLPLGATGALWQIEPERQDALRPAIIAMLNYWKERPALRSLGTEMKPLLPALKDIAADPKYAELRPWAILAMRKIYGAGPEQLQ